MKIGFIGLGRMGGNMVQRLLKDKHEIVVWDPLKTVVDAMASKGAIASEGIEDLVLKLPPQKIVWLMVPAGKIVDNTIAELTKYMKTGDIIIDGGNSKWNDTIQRAETLNQKSIHYIDCGTSGGLWGLENGYCLMYGGNKDACDTCTPIFASLTEPGGYLYCGESGSGHFVKMIHNGIEYGMMQSFAEGYEIMQKSPFNLDLQQISELWMHGSVIRSWLLELIAKALKEDTNLASLQPHVDDSGEARWTIETAMNLDVPTPAITASLYARFNSREKDSFAFKLLAAMRNQFGGHAVKKKE
ncbi:MAG: phosphogluconate dehydrogenase (NAD(+)-dependent, decarboxylating) [Bacteroidales bacterium]